MKAASIAEKNLCLWVMNYFFSAVNWQHALITLCQTPASILLFAFTFSCILKE
jgi:hypothetical protein